MLFLAGISAGQNFLAGQSFLARKSGDRYTEEGNVILLCININLCFLYILPTLSWQELQDEWICLPDGSMAKPDGHAHRRELVYLLEKSQDWRWLDGVYAIQLSVRGNQNEGFNRVRAMPTTVKNEEFSETNTINQSFFLVLQGTPKPTAVSPHPCDNRGFVAVGLPTLLIV